MIAATARQVDVIIPLYNNEIYAVEAIKSVLAQTYPVRNVIVVDDGSTDSSATIIEQHFAEDARVCIIRGDHRGLPATRNRGIAESDADFIAFLDSDDLWLPIKIEQQIKRFDDCPDAGAIYCDYTIINEKGIPVPHIYRDPPRLHGDIFNALLEGNLLSGSASAIIIKRALFAQAGLFDESLSFAEDWDMWLRLAKIAKIEFVDQPLVLIRRHERQMSSAAPPLRSLRDFVQHLRIWSKWPDEVLSNHRVINKIRAGILELYLRPVIAFKRRQALLRIMSQQVHFNLHPAIRCIICDSFTYSDSRHRLRIWAICLCSPGAMMRILVGRSFPRLRSFKKELSTIWAKRK